MNKDESSKIRFQVLLREISWDIGAGSGGCFMGVSEFKGTTHFLRDFGEIGKKIFRLSVINFPIFNEK